MKVAKDSFNHRSFHQVMVTRLPNHMWASSCKLVIEKRKSLASVGF